MLACVLVFGAAVPLLTPARSEEIGIFGALVLCAAIYVETMRRLGTAPGLTRGLLGAWWFPTILLLPPVYSLIIPIPVFLLLHLRIRCAAAHQRVLGAASVALSGFTASMVFHTVLTGDMTAAVGAPTRIAQEVLTTGRGVFLAVLCCALFIAVDRSVLAMGGRLGGVEPPWQSRPWDREAVMVGGVELCVGVTVAILAGISAALLVLVLPPVLLQQRSLLFQQLQTAARTDPKTGLLNAGTWEAEAGAVLARARRSRISVAVLLADVDHFKRVNDAHGHLFGDKVLLDVATTITHQLRQSDVIGRFGGEEFAVLIPGADTAEACRVAERLRVRVARMVPRSGEVSATVTVSIGVAVLGLHGDDLVQLLTAADLALYRAKDAGRNRVCLPVIRAPIIPPQQTEECEPAEEPGAAVRRL